MAYGKDYADSFRTDPAGWRLKVSEDSHGQHKWVYLPPGAARDAWPQAHVDVYSMGLETVSADWYGAGLTRRACRTSPRPRRRSRPRGTDSTFTARCRARTGTGRPSMEVG